MVNLSGCNFCKYSAPVKKQRQFRKLSILAIFIFTSLLCAQTPDTLWTRAHGGSNIDVGHSVQQTQDGGFIIAGYTRSFGTMSGRNAWLLKTDSLGHQQWNNAFGGDDDDEAYAVLQTDDGGYVFTGYSESFGVGLKDVFLIKADSAGNSQWLRTFSGPQDDEGYDLQPTADGGFIIAGVTSSYGSGSRDVWLIKTDGDGIQQWNRTFGSFGSDGAWAVQQTSDKGYIITGWTFSYGPGFVGNAWLVKTDSSGNMLWNKYFGDTDADRGYSVQQTSDGGYIVCGYTGSYGAGLYDMLLIRTDASGNQQWLKTFGGSGRDYGNAVKQTADGGFILTGYTLSFGAGGDDLWIIKTNAAGMEQWSSTYGGSASDVGYDIEQTAEGGFIAAGHTLSFGAGLHDVFLVRLAAEAQALFSVSADTLVFAGTVVGDTLVDSLTVTNKGAADLAISSVNSTNPYFSVVPAAATISPGMSRVFAMQLNAAAAGLQQGVLEFHHNGSSSPDSVIVLADVITGFSSTNTLAINQFRLEPNFPNPFNPSTTIRFSIARAVDVKLEIYSLSGELVSTLLNGPLAAGSFEQVWNGRDEHGRPAASGVYIVRLRTEFYSKTYRMVLLR